MDHAEQLKNVCGPAFERIETAQGQHCRQLGEMLDLLRGTNGTPGALERLRGVEHVAARHAERLQGHHDVLFGVGKEKPGLVDDVRDQQRRHDRTSKIALAAIVGAIAQGLIWLRGVFTIR